MIPKAVVSFTDLIPKGQSTIRSFVITANKMTANFVPCGILRLLLPIDD